MKSYSIMIMALLTLHCAILTVYLGDLGAQGGGPGTGVYADDLEEAWNATAIEEGWDYDTTNFISDLRFGLKVLGTSVRILIWGLPDLMTAFNVPVAISVPTYLIVTYLQFRWTIWFITGRGEEG